MILFDISELDFRLKAKRRDGVITYTVTCDPYQDDTLQVPNGMTLYGIDILLDYDSYKIAVLADLKIISIDSIQKIEVIINDHELLLEELDDIMEDD